MRLLLQTMLHYRCLHVKRHTLFMTNDQNAEEIAQKIVMKLAEIRQEQNLSYDNLAMLIDTNKSTIHAMESGKTLPTLMTCIKICQALGVTLSDISRDSGF